METGRVQIVSKYTNPHDALEGVLAEKPDIVFLDIEMPEVSGIELAERIQQSLPETHIVFVTAFNEYAVKAFELNAIDYIVKPVLHDRLNKTLQRISKELLPIASVTTPTPLRSAIICAFPSLSFTWDDNMDETIDVRWRTSKVRGVFTLLLQHRGAFVRKDVLLETFWPDIDAEKGIMQLYSTIYQIRKTIAATDFDMGITNHENGYRLDLNNVQVDVDVWEKGVEQFPVVSSKTLPMHRKLLDLYRGDYLAKEDYLWAEGERERLRVLWLKQISDVADYLVANDQIAEAITLYLRVQSAQPFIDYSYFKLMQLYSQIGDMRSVDQQYTQLTKMLVEEYDIQPSVIIQEWYQQRRKI